MRSLIIIFCILIVNITFSQVRWEKTYGAWGIDRAFAVKQVTDTGFLVVGSTSSFAKQSQFYIVKTHKNGDIDWTKHYGGEGIETAYDVAVTYDSGYAVVGVSNSYGNGYQIYLTRLNQVGDTLWTKTYGGEDWDFAYAIEEMPDSGYIIAGETYSYGAGNNDGYLLRLDKHGDTLWTKTFGGISNDYFKDVKINDKGQLIAVGGTKNFGALDEDIYLLKFNPDGSLIYNETYGFAGDDFASKLTVDTGGIIVAASTHIYGSDDFEGLVVKFDTNGVKKFDQAFFDFSSGDYNQHARAVTKYKNQDSVVVGVDQEQDAWSVIGTQMTGYKLHVSPGLPRITSSSFIKYASSFDENFVTDVDTCYDGGYIYCGYGNGKIGSAGNKTMYVLKTGNDNLTNCGDVDQGCIGNEYDFSAGFAGLTNAENNIELEFFPNPITSKEVLQIKINDHGAYSLRLINQVGQYMFSNMKINRTKSINLSNYNLAKGIYILQFTDESLNSITKKLIITN